MKVLGDTIGAVRSHGLFSPQNSATNGGGIVAGMGILAPYTTHCGWHSGSFPKTNAKQETKSNRAPYSRSTKETRPLPRLCLWCWWVVEISAIDVANPRKFLVPLRLVTSAQVQVRGRLPPSIFRVPSRLEHSARSFTSNLAR